MSEPQYLSPTPVKYPGLSLLAKGLAGVNSFATAEDKAVPGKKANALLSGLASMVGLPEAQALMEKLAYGERLTTGKGQTLKPAENVVEGALALAPLAQGLARRVVKVAGKIPTQLDSSPNALVWHGSPHKFDKFDSSKIGTGEGAQAYGHGLYLADKRGVAEEYKRALSAGRGDSDDDTIARVLDAIGNPANAADELERRARYANIPGGSDRLRSLAEKIRSGHDPRGSLYQVDLPDDQIARMLDWDTPLGKQPSILNAIDQKYDPEIFVEQMGSSLARPGGDFLKALGATRDSGKSAAVSQMLRKDFDIPGIRYLDGNSRSAAQGSSNYVVFPGNESFLQILERNGIPLNKGLAGK